MFEIFPNNQFFILREDFKHINTTAIKTPNPNLSAWESIKFSDGHNCERNGSTSEDSLHDKHSLQIPRVSCAAHQSNVGTALQSAHFLLHKRRRISTRRKSEHPAGKKASLAEAQTNAEVRRSEFQFG